MTSTKRGLHNIPQPTSDIRLELAGKLFCKVMLSGSAPRDIFAGAGQSAAWLTPVQAAAIDIEPGVIGSLKTALFVPDGPVTSLLTLLVLGMLKSAHGKMVFLSLPMLGLNSRIQLKLVSGQP